MMNKWICACVVVLFLADGGCWARDIFVSLNLDYLPPAVKSLKIYQGSDSDVRNCPLFLRNENQVVYLDISKLVTSFICNNSMNTVTFNVFTYYTNIAQALITIVNNGYSVEQLRTMLSSMPQKAVIVNFANNYVNFVLCPNNFTNCQYQSNDHRNNIATVPNLSLFSACQQSNDGSSCITQVEFSMTLYDMDTRPNSMGSDIIVRKSNMLPSYDVITSCRNGGTLVNATSSEIASCTCPSTENFIERGPQCEVLQLSLKQQNFLYVLPNTVSLRMEFSLYSIGHQGITEIFRIQDGSNPFVMKYSVNQAIQILEFASQNISIPYALDANNNWVQILIIVSVDNVMIQVNEVRNLVNARLNLNLDTVPLVLFSSFTKTNDICFGYLKINNRIVDLYLPSYTNCRPNCVLCRDFQKCVFVPFKSDANANCFCNIGYTLIGGTSCGKNAGSIIQIPYSSEIPIPVTSMDISGAQFRFRTLTSNGAIVTLVLSNPTGYRILIGIFNDFLFGAIIGSVSNITLTSDFYKVTDGKWHSIRTTFDNNVLELAMDEYYVKRLLIPRGFFPNAITIVRIESFVLGRLSGSLGSSTCFDTFTLIPIGFTGNFYTIPDNAPLGKGCNEGTNCSSITCGENQQCVNLWQNSSCVCNDRFVNSGSSCVFFRCLPNPCQNGGTCLFDNTKNDYRCNCPNSYNGNNCETSIQVAGFMWWIILLIILILLLILIILLIYCCCCRRRKEKENVPDIDKVHENTVCYNDQAGEVDYHGPPINFNIMKSSLKPTNSHPDNAKPKASLYPSDDLQKRKIYIDANNNDLNIDHPLDYGFEGFNSDAESVSSLGSGSTDEQLNIQPLDTTDNKFDYLKNLYE